MMDRAEPETSVVGIPAELLDFVTVVFESEVHLLRLQARSMALFLDRAMTGRLVVIDNSVHGLRRRERERLLLEYGDLAGRVSFVRPHEICDLPRAVGCVVNKYSSWRLRGC